MTSNLMERLSAGGEVRDGKRVRNKFTPQEDDTIIRIVNDFGAHSWRLIAANLPGRTARQIRERYVNYLAPNVCKEPWTEEEDQQLREKVAEHGRKWSQIAKYFENRTDVTIKNRWLKLQRCDRKKNRAKSRKAKKRVVVVQRPLSPPQQTKTEAEAGDEIILDEDFNGFMDFHDFTVTSQIEWDVMF